MARINNAERTTHNEKKLPLKYVNIFRAVYPSVE